MSTKTKIVVLHMKELVYTAIFVLLGGVLLILLICMFQSKEETEETMTYIPGVYTSSIEFSNTTIEVAVTVDENHINSVTLNNPDETVTTMYPLMEPALESISQQIVENQSTEDITYSEDNQYTSQILLQAVESALEKARTTTEDTEDAEDIESTDDTGNTEDIESTDDTENTEDTEK